MPVDGMKSPGWDSTDIGKNYKSGLFKFSVFIEDPAIIHLPAHPGGQLAQSPHKPAASAPEWLPVDNKGAC